MSIYDQEIELLDLNFLNLSIESCPKISFLEIEIDKDISSYKPYLENYFSLPGNKKTNFFTDISNYISYERGQPTHCFDRETITESLTFCDKYCDEDFKTLLGEKIRLKDKNCVFAADDEIVSLAGVMGGESTACSKKQKKFWWNALILILRSIIGKAVKYNLKSDAAHKFERGVDFASQEKVLRRFISVIKDHVPIKSLKMKTFIGKEFEDKYLPVEIEKVNKILGTNLKYEEYVNLSK